MKNFSFVFLFVFWGCTSNSRVPREDEMDAYLMFYFQDPTHSLYMAVSTDGYTFTDINNFQPVIAGDTIADQKGIRDPHITRGPDNCFYMAMTDLHLFGREKGYRDTEWDRDADKYDWGNNRGFVLMKSKDLIHWSISRFRFHEAFSGYEEMGCAWAPETIYDPEEGKMMIYYTMRMGHGLTKLYYSYTDDDFTKLVTEPKLLFEYPKADCQYLDADITKVGDKYYMFYVAHDEGGGVKKAVSSHINRGYVYEPDWVDPEEPACEAPNLWKRIGEDKWVLMYDIFGIQPHNFGFSETADLDHFTDLGRFNEGTMKAVNFRSPKHGAVIQITREEAERLAKHWRTELKF